MNTNLTRLVNDLTTREHSLQLAGEGLQEALRQLAQPPTRAALLDFLEHSTRTAAQAQADENEELQKRRQHLQGSLTDVEDEVNQLHQMVVEGESQLEEERAQLAEQAARLEQEVAALPQRIQAQLEEHQRLVRDRLADLRQAAESVQQALAAASQGLESLHQSLGQHQNEAGGQLAEAGSQIRAQRATLEEGLADLHRRTQGQLTTHADALHSHHQESWHGPLQARGRELKECLSRHIHGGLEHSTRQLIDEAWTRATRQLDESQAKAQAEHRALERLPGQLPEAGGSVEKSLERSHSRLDLLGGR